MKNIIIVLMLTIVFAQNTFAEAPSEPLYVDLSTTFGFTTGQRYVLNHIMVEYPSLSIPAKQADLDFKATFGLAEKNIEKAMRAFLKESFPGYVANLKDNLTTMLKSQRITRDIAVQIIADIASRAKGNMPSPILETLLIYQFKERPVNEFTRGFKRSYRTKGHRKAKGVDFQIEYAKSWSKREGNRPNIIQFFSSNNGRGPAYAGLMVRDFIKEAEKEMSLTPEDVQALKTLVGSKELVSEMLAENSLREMVNGMGVTNVRKINIKRIVIDQWPGAVIEFIANQQRLDITTTGYHQMYIAIYKNYMIFLNCTVSKLLGEPEETFRARIVKFLPLFQLMANSLVIQSQY